MDVRTSSSSARARRAIRAAAPWHSVNVVAAGVVGDESVRAFSQRATCPTRAADGRRLDGRRHLQLVEARIAGVRVPPYRSMAAKMSGGPSSTEHAALSTASARPPSPSAEQGGPAASSPRAAGPGRSRRVRLLARRTTACIIDRQVSARTARTVLYRRSTFHYRISAAWRGVQHRSSILHGGVRHLRRVDVCAASGTPSMFPG